MLKTNLEWIKKKRPGDLKIWKEMISEIDWKDVGKKQLEQAAHGQGAHPERGQGLHRPLPG